MTSDNAPALSPLWQRAAVLGSLWAASEIVLGSLLHNARVPFAGHILTFLGVAILVAGHRMWRMPGLLVRAGLIAALMKSISPSAVLLGPMVAIAMQGLLVEGALRFLRGSVAGYLLGGALAMSWTLGQKIVSLLLTYGPDAVRLYGDLVALAERQVGPVPLGPWGPLVVLGTLNLALGVGAALVGVRLTPGGGDVTVLASGRLPEAWSRRLAGRQKGGARPSLPWLAFWALALPVGLVVLARLPLAGKALVAAGAVALAAARHGPALRRLARPGFWAGLALVTTLAGAVAGALSPDPRGGWLPGVGMGLGMSLHAVYVTLCFAALSVELTHPSLKRWLEGAGGGQLHRALQGAFATLPLVVAALPPGRRLARHPLLTLEHLLAHVDGWLAALNQGVPLLGVVTGEQGTGKTAALTRAVEVLRARGVRVGGVLAPGTVQEGRRWTVDLVDLATGERTQLATRDPASPWPEVGSFRVNPAAAAAGLRALSPEPGGPEVLVVDEIGPWELAGEGWAPALEALRGSPVPILATVRRSLLADVLSRYAPGSEPPVWDASALPAEEIADAVAGTFTAAWQPGREPPPAPGS